MPLHNWYNLCQELYTVQLSELFQTDDDESDFEGFDISDLNILFLESDDDNDEFLGF